MRVFYLNTLWLLLAAVISVRCSALRLMSYNIRAGRGMDNVLNISRTAEAINEWKPDVVALQEVDNATQRTPFDETAVLAQLTGTHGYFLQNRVFQAGGYGVAILSRTEALKVRTFHYHPPGKPAPNCSSEPTTLADFCQGALALLLVDSESTQPFWLVTTHIGLNGMQTPEVSQLVEEFLPTLSGARAVFATGDFNSVPTDTCMKPISKLYTDTWPNCGVGDGFTFDSAKPYERIDYIFQRPPLFTCKAATVHPTLASDHRPLVADFVF